MKLKVRAGRASINQESTTFCFPETAAGRDPELEVGRLGPELQLWSSSRQLWKVPAPGGAEATLCPTSKENSGPRKVASAWPLFC